jgi:hypothetical protein
MGNALARRRVEVIFDEDGAANAEAESLRALLERVEACRGKDEALSHDIWWQLVDVPSGATRERDGQREVNFAAGDPHAKPFWRAISSNYFEDFEAQRLLVDSIDRVADLAGRVLEGWKWQVYSGGGPDNEQCFACVYCRMGAFSALADTLPTALAAAIIKAKIALAAVDEGRGETLQ